MPTAPHDGQSRETRLGGAGNFNGIPNWLAGEDTNPEAGASLQSFKELSKRVRLKARIDDDDIISGATKSRGNSQKAKRHGEEDCARIVEDYLFSGH